MDFFLLEGFYGRERNVEGGFRHVKMAKEILAVVMVGNSEEVDVVLKTHKITYLP